jgi:chemotaxis protein histidine kinase CheA
MANEFSITTATNKFTLDAAQRGEVAVTVSNATERKLQGRAQLEAGGGAKVDWFKLDGEATRTLNVAESTQYTIKVAAPPGTPAGDYSVRLNMIGVANPDEEFSEGPTVAFALKQAIAAAPVKKGFPWWIVIVVVGVLVVGGVIFGVMQMRQPAAPPATPTPALDQTATAEALTAGQTATAEALAAGQTATAEALAAEQTATAAAASQATATAEADAQATASAAAAAAAAQATATADAELAATQATATAIAQATATAIAQATAQAEAQAAAAAQATATAIAMSCPDQPMLHVEGNNGGFVEFYLRAGPHGTVRSWLDGYNTQYIFPTCRGIGWSNAVFTCSNGAWVGSPNYYNNALCHGATNNSQRDLRVGAQ